MFEFWREATATSVPRLLCQSGRRRPENVSILISSLFFGGREATTGNTSVLRRLASVLNKSILLARPILGDPGAVSLCLKTFFAPFLPTRLTAPGSPRMAHPCLIYGTSKEIYPTPRASVDIGPLHMSPVDRLARLLG